MKRVGKPFYIATPTRRQEKGQAITYRFVKRFEEELTKLNNGLQKKRCLKNYNKFLEKIGRLRQQ